MSVIRKPTLYTDLDVANCMLREGAKNGHPSTFKKIHFGSRSRFSKSLTLKLDNLYLFLEYSSREYVNEFRLTWHQSPIGPLVITLAMFERIFSSYISKDIFTEGYLARMDVCFHLDLSFTAVKAGLYRPRVKVTRVYFSKTRTITFGGARSNQLTAYEKNYKGKKVVRGEFRFINGIPLSHIGDLEELLLLDWNKYFQLYKWDLKLLKSFIINQSPDAQKIKKIFESSKVNTLVYALKPFRGSGRFSQEIEPILNQVAPLMDLNQLIRSELVNNYFKDFPFEQYSKGVKHGKEK